MVPCFGRWPSTMARDADGLVPCFTGASASGLGQANSIVGRRRPGLDPVHDPVHDPVLVCDPRKKQWPRLLWLPPPSTDGDSNRRRCLLVRHQAADHASTTASRVGATVAWCPVSRRWCPASFDVAPPSTAHHGGHLWTGSVQLLPQATRPATAWIARAVDAERTSANVSDPTRPSLWREMIWRCAPTVTSTEVSMSTSTARQHLK